MTRLKYMLLLLALIFFMISLWVGYLILRVPVDIEEDPLKEEKALYDHANHIFCDSKIDDISNIIGADSWGKPYTVFKMDCDWLNCCPDDKCFIVISGGKNRKIDKKYLMYSEAVENFGTDDIILEVRFRNCERIENMVYFQPYFYYKYKLIR
jgi:hypothetical protein